MGHWGGEKKLFPYIPFYIARYEKELMSGNNLEAAVKDLEYFRDEIVRLHGESSLTDGEMIDLMGFINTIITHITNGNEHEERLVRIMGGTVIETESEKLMKRGMKQGIRQGMRQGQAKMVVELGREDGLDEATILRRLQEKVGLSLKDAETYLAQYMAGSVYH